MPGSGILQLFYIIITTVGRAYFDLSFWDRKCKRKRSGHVQSFVYHLQILFISEYRSHGGQKTEIKASCYDYSAISLSIQIE